MTSTVHFKSRDGDRNPVRGNRALIGFRVVTIGIGIVPLLGFRPMVLQCVLSFTWGAAPGCVL